MKFFKDLFTKPIFLSLLLILSITSSNVLAATDHTEIPNTNTANIQATTPVPSESEAYSKMIALQSQYPEGTPWTNANEYTSKAKGSVIYMGGGCVAFAYILSDAAFGDLPFSIHNDQSRIRVGDILRINNDTHSVIVLEVRPTELVIAEGNYNSSIHWGRTLDRNNLITNYIMTRYDGDTGSSIPEPEIPSENLNDLVPIYRLYNPVTTEHLYTSSANENQELSSRHGWNSENVGWYAPSSGAPVYRLFNPAINDHLYTTDDNEVSVLTSSQGWVKDNNGAPLFFSGGLTNVYRLYNPSNARHHLTSDPLEYLLLAFNGWEPEGVKLLAVY